MRGWALAEVERRKGSWARGWGGRMGTAREAEGLGEVMEEAVSTPSFFLIFLQGSHPSFPQAQGRGKSSRTEREI